MADDNEEMVLAKPDDKVYLQAPDYMGGKPDDWNPKHWLAYCTLAHGGTYQEAADLVGWQKGTVSSYVHDWRQKYGDDLLRNRQVGMSSLTAKDRESGQRRVKEVWAAKREGQAIVFGKAATKAKNLSTKIIDRYLDNPNFIKDLTIKDAYELARISDIYAKRADELADISKPGKEDGMKAKVDLSALDRALREGGNQETLKAVEVMFARFSTETGRGEVEEVIEISEQ